MIRSLFCLFIFYILFILHDIYFTYCLFYILYILHIAYFIFCIFYILHFCILHFHFHDNDTRRRRRRRRRQPWHIGRALRCGWEVPRSKPSRSRTLTCTHGSFRAYPLQVKRSTWGGMRIVNYASLTAGSATRPSWPQWCVHEHHLVDMPVSLRRGRHRATSRMCGPLPPRFTRLGGCDGHTMLCWSPQHTQQSSCEPSTSKQEEIVNDAAPKLKKEDLSHECPLYMCLCNIYVRCRC